MSDKLKIIGVGGAGKNSIPKSFSEKSYFVLSNIFPNAYKLKPFLETLPRTEKSVVISSPAGLYSSQVLPEVCREFHDRNEEVYLISIMPFASESSERRRRANESLKVVRKYVNSVIYIENENFVSSMMNSRWSDLLDKINVKVLIMIRSFLDEIDSFPEEREMGIYHSEGSTIEELERNFLLSTKKPSEGMVGTAEIPNKLEMDKIQSVFPIEFLGFRTGKNYSISGALLLSRHDYDRNQGIPLGPYIRTH